ncbi:MAG: hypothetical protein MZV63_25645 [Marinilabiliales bacterium]|nr:hypothetical protein [Marinilabiliales bacterium]
MVSSAEAISMNSMGWLVQDKGLIELAHLSLRHLLRVDPNDDPLRLQEVLDGAPSFRNSGFEATSKVIF